MNKYLVHAVKEDASEDNIYRSVIAPSKEFAIQMMTAAFVGFDRYAAHGMGLVENDNHARFLN